MSYGGIYMIKWKEEYSVGIELIDSQHKRLFEIADQAYELLKNDYYTDKYDKIVTILQELKDYTVFHFNAEEKYMESIGYKRLLSHKVQHDDFIDKINSYDLYQVDQDQDKYITDLLDFIIDWISNHILYTDKKYASQTSNL